MWTNTLVIKLIGAFEARRELWDPRDDNYKNKALKAAAWEEIARFMRMSRLTVEAKVHGLRSQFLRERKKIVRSRKRGGGVDNLHRIWFAYKSMRFLIPTVVATKSYDTVDEEEIMKQIQQAAYDDGIDEETCDPADEQPDIEEIYIDQPESDPDTPNTQPSSSTSKKQHPTEIRPVKIKTERRSAGRRSPSQSSQSGKDDAEQFGDYITREFRRIKNEHAQTIAKQHILNIIFCAQLGKYDKPRRQAPAEAAGAKQNSSDEDMYENLY